MKDKKGQKEEDDSKKKVLFSTVLSGINSFNFSHRSNLAGTNEHPHIIKKDYDDDGNSHQNSPVQVQMLAVLTKAQELRHLNPPDSQQADLRQGQGMQQMVDECNKLSSKKRRPFPFFLMGLEDDNDHNKESIHFGTDLKKKNVIDLMKRYFHQSQNCECSLEQKTKNMCWYTLYQSLYLHLRNRNQQHFQSSTANWMESLQGQQCIEQGQEDQLQNMKILAKEKEKNKRNKQHVFDLYCRVKLNEGLHYRNTLQYIAQAAKITRSKSRKKKSLELRTIFQPQKNYLNSLIFSINQQEPLNITIDKKNKKLVIKTGRKNRVENWKINRAVLNNLRPDYKAYVPDIKDKKISQKIQEEWKRYEALREITKKIQDGSFLDSTFQNLFEKKNRIKKEKILIKGMIKRFRQNGEMEKLQRAKYHLIKKRQFYEMLKDVEYKYLSSDQLDDSDSSSEDTPFVKNERNYKEEYDEEDDSDDDCSYIEYSSSMEGPEVDDDQDDDLDGDQDDDQSFSQDQSCSQENSESSFYQSQEHQDQDKSNQIPIKSNKMVKIKDNHRNK